MPPTTVPHTEPTAQPGVIAALPFTSSSHQHTEPAFTFTGVPGANVVQFNPQDIPAYGYIRHLFLEVTSAGGAGGALAADGPWNMLSNITLQDVNGANIVGPIDGYALFLANIIGGYGFNQSPSNCPWFVGSAPNPSFFVRVPVEVSEHDGLGALSNQNSAANYKVSLTLNTSAAIFATAPTTPPVVTIKGWLEAWTLPAPVDARQRPQAQVPPLLGTGQYISSANRPVLAGSNVTALTRVGNHIRNLILIGRDNAGARSDGAIPDPLMFNWDGNQIHNASQKYLQQYAWERLNAPGFIRPVGVFFLPYSHSGDGRAGNDSPDYWLPTAQSSRIEFQGVSINAGSIQIVTNEVAPVEMDQAQRYQFPSTTDSLVNA